LCERLAHELARIATGDAAERRASLARAGWSELVSREVEGVAADREAFLDMFQDLPPVTGEQEADALLYVGFTVTWTLVRSVLEAQGIYANSRHQCLEDLHRTCGELFNLDVFDTIFAAWDQWETGSPAIEEMSAWYAEVAEHASVLQKHFGADAYEEFSGWPPPTI